MEAAGVKIGGMENRSSFLDFLRSFWGNWFAFMSGGPSVPAAIAALYVENETAKICLWITAVACFVLSSFFVWRKERQKVIALTQHSPQLLTEISSLFNFPEAAHDKVPPTTLIESLLADQRPRRLFDIIMNQNENEIQQIPKIGCALIEHRKEFYKFRQGIIRFENETIKRISQMFSGGDAWNFLPAWKMFYQYAFFRFAGSSQDDIKSHGNFFNYSITWDDAENVFTRLSGDAQVSGEIKKIIDSQEQLVARVDEIAKAL